LALQTWLADCRALASPDIVIILVGNKSDISSGGVHNGLTGDVKSFANNDFRGGEVAGGFHREREVSVEEAGRWASREGIGFLEASALDGTNVEEAFLRCARQILTKVELGEIDPSSPHSGIQYGDTPIYSNPPSLFGTSPGTILSSVNGHARGKIRLGATGVRRRRETGAGSVLGEWGEVFSSGRGGGGCCS